MRKTETSGKSDTLFGIIIAIWLFVGWFVCPGYLIWLITPDQFKYSLLYSFLYQTNHRNVHIARQPADCDWSHAPLGDKGCRYTRHIVAVKAHDGSVTSVWTMWEKVQP